MGTVETLIRNQVSTRYGPVILGFYCIERGGTENDTSRKFSWIFQCRALGFFHIPSVRHQSSMEAHLCVMQ